MENSDTVNLLKECDAGAKMAVSSINDVLEKINDSKLKQILVESKSTHEKLCNEIHTLLSKHGSGEKDPTPVAKGMSWIKTNVKPVSYTHLPTLSHTLPAYGSSGLPELS